VLNLLRFWRRPHNRGRPCAVPAPHKTGPAVLESLLWTLFSTTFLCQLQNFMAVNPTTPAPPIRFGVFEVDLEKGELRKKGHRLRLQRQPFQLLAILLEKPNQVVTRDEIQRRIWVGDTFVDFDHGVNRAVNKVREVLGDSADNPRFIETLSGRGYRFIAPVQRELNPPDDGKKILLVLPFANMSLDAEQEYFSDGLTEEMIAHLSRLNPERLGVIARTSAMQFKGTHKDIRLIGQELGVQLVLEGSIRRGARNRIRITAQLIQVSDQTHLWAETYDRGLKDVLTIQKDVAERIARSLAFELVPEHPVPALRSSIGSHSEAYELHLRGRYYLNQRVEHSCLKAVEYFDEALLKYPVYAPGYVGLADAYTVIGFYGAIAPKVAFEKAKLAARKAVQLDDNLSEAHTILGYATLQYDWDWLNAEPEHKRAIELNPGSYEYDWYGFNLVQVGQFTEALAALERARRIDPLSLIIACHIGWTLYFAREYEKSLRQLEKTVEFNPGFPLARYHLGKTYLQVNDFRRGIEHLQNAVEGSGHHPGALAALAYALGAAGRQAEGREVLAKILNLQLHRHVLAYFVAFAMNSLSTEDETLEWLEKACEERSGWILHLQYEPAFDHLRSNREFMTLLKRIDPRKPSLATLAPSRFVG
jgi:TolB-like protein/Flp pilus assembly protein TadD